MKKALLICILMLSVAPVSGWEMRPAQNKNVSGGSSAAQAAKKFPKKKPPSSSPPGRRRPVSASTTTPASVIPDIVSVSPDQAPTGALIELTLKSDLPPDVAGSLEVQIANVPALTQSAFERKIVVKVPKIDSPPTAGQPSPVSIKLFSNGTQGKPFRGRFSVISSDVPFKDNLQISAIEWAGVNQINIRFTGILPVALWGSITFFVEDRPITQIDRMSERLFTVTLPKDLPQNLSVQSPYRVLFAIDTKEGKYQSNVERLFPPKPTPTQTPPPASSPATEEPTSLLWLVLAVVLAGLLGAAVPAFFYYRFKKAQRQPVEAPASPPETLKEEPPAAPEVEQLRLPEAPPEDLVAACIAGECVLYAGAGLSAQANLPTWKDFIHRLLEWAREHDFIDEDEAASFRAEIDTGQADAVADVIISRLRTELDRERLNHFLKEVFIKPASPSALHSQLLRIKFSAALTTNFDNLLERIYQAPPEQVYTPRDAEPLLTALTRRGFFILKLYGALDQPDTVMVAPAQYEEAIRGAGVFLEFMRTLFFSRTLLFVGASLEGIEAYLKGIGLPSDISRRHYALVTVSGNAWRAKASVLFRRYGITVLPYTASDDHAELREFLSRLSERVMAQSVATAGTAPTVSRLKKIQLKNIGPFEELDLRLDPSWQVFLGDNGVGKSTILKAIALALCGEKAQPFAERLLRRPPKTDQPSGASSDNVGDDEMEGKITLRTDNNGVYHTIIKRPKNRDVEVVSTTARPLEAEGWLAVGFPPLRTANWNSIRGPEADMKIKSRPVPEDVLPLLRGDVDQRLDKLKQWIVNMDSLARNRKSSAGQGRRYEDLVRKVFTQISKITEGINLNYIGVEAEESGTHRVIIRTDDGVEVPLEALSQGTISLIGWVGILMQRLYEVFDQDEDPTKRYALILMDEIDAHMHPAWQRTLVNHLKDIFPNAQFIVTTHSPLVVGGMPIEQIIRFARNAEKKIVQLPVEPDMTLGYTDQILTSTLFGLPTTLDDDTEKTMKEFYRLDALSERNEQEQKDYEMYRQQLMVRVPPASASYEEKRQQQLSEAAMMKQLGEKLGQVSPAGGQLLVERADNLRASLEGGNRDDSDSI